MTIHILGLGSIGILCAHNLRRHDLNFVINILARRSSHLPSTYTIREPDLRITRLSRLLDDTNGAPIDTLLVTTKAHQTRKALEPHLPRITSKSLLIFLQNGMGVVDSIRDILSSNRIVLGTTTAGAYRIGYDTIQWVNIGETVFAPIPKTALTGAEESVISMLGEQISFAALEDRMFWKLGVNACINPVTAIYNVKNSVLTDSSTAAHFLALRLAKEVVRVYSVQRPGIDMSGFEDLVMQLAGDTGGNVSSMLADVRAGRETEVDFINGCIVRMGQEAGVDVPANTE